MKWDAVIRAARATVDADGTLVGLFPVRRYAGIGKHQPELLEYQLIADGETELWAPCTIQWDLWSESFDTIQAGERQLRALFHVETQRYFGGMPMWSQYQGGEWLATPNRDGYFGRAIRFVMTPLRARYEPVPAP